MQNMIQDRVLSSNQNQSQNDNQDHHQQHTHAVQDVPNLVQGRLFFQANHGCGICYEQVGPAEDAIPMFCCHHLNLVHTHCLVKWCVQKRTQVQNADCPFCRKVLLSPTQFDDLYEWRETPETNTTHTNCINGTDTTTESHESRNYILNRASRHILAFFPANQRNPLSQLQLVRLTLFSYITMLINLFLLCMLFTIALRSWSSTQDYKAYNKAYNTAYNTPSHASNTPSTNPYNAGRDNTMQHYNPPKLPNKETLTPPTHARTRRDSSYKAVPRPKHGIDNFDAFLILDKTNH